MVVAIVFDTFKVSNLRILSNKDSFHLKFHIFSSFASFSKKRCLLY